MKSILDFLRSLIEGGYIGQAIIATILVSGFVYMAVKGLPIPNEYIGIMSAVVAWYFRGQAQTQAAKEERLRIK